MPVFPQSAGLREAKMAGGWLDTRADTAEGSAAQVVLEKVFQEGSGWLDVTLTPSCRLR